MTLGEWGALVIAAALVTWVVRSLARAAVALWWLHFVFRPELLRWLDEVFGPEDE